MHIWVSLPRNLTKIYSRQTIESENKIAPAYLPFNAMPDKCSFFSSIQNRIWISFLFKFPIHLHFSLPAFEGFVTANKIKSDYGHILEIK